MNLILFEDDEVVINVDHIDGIIPHGDGAYIYVGGAGYPFFVEMPFKKVVKIIKDFLNEKGG